MKNMTPTKVIMISFGIIIAAFAAIILNSFNERNVVTTQITFKQLGLDLSNASDFLTDQAQQYVQYGEKQYYDAYMREVEVTQTRPKVVAELEKLGAPQNELALVEKAAQLSNTLAELESKAFEAVKAGDFETARYLMFGPDYQAGKKPIVETMNEFQNTMAARTNNSVKFARTLSNVLTVIVIILVLAAAFIVNMSVKAMNSALKSAITELESTSAHIIQASEQFASVSSTLADGSASQTAAIAETLSTMNETVRIISENTENTRQATKLAKYSKSSADSGKLKMQEMVKSMEQLKESSQTISRIIKTIDDIAFQTNLLAINATVEAARAGGDAGRSFAVVAEEVRNLAKKSADSASSTADMIEKNIAFTNTSGEISREVEISLVEITEQFENLDKIISDINTAGEEQANGAKQVNLSINNMEQNMNINTAMIQKSAQAAGELQTQSDKLSTIIQKINHLVGK